jgi:DNA (cytosine-5)-methyltransferase 1|nr:MAG TPA: DNA cytosine methyltransferase [Caudoviricetes sp.]
MNENVNYQSIEEIDALYVDLFCGAGGTSTGVEKARIFGRKCAKVVACVNHDKNAIASHASNHPDAMHFTEDIRTLELSPLKTHLHKCRKEHPEAAVVLWASLECTNFSKAKGGQARNPDSRTLAEHLFRYIEAIEPDYIMIENVEEFMSWGEVDENGKPISMDKGKSYQRWVRNVKRYGCDFSHRILNAADFGAYTSRKRFFGIFAKKGLPIVFPSPTHAKKAENTLFGSRQKWKAVKDVLDFSDEGTSIFTRKKPLSEKTYERVYAGLVRFGSGSDEKERWMLKYNSINGKTGKHVPPGVEEPCPTVPTKDRFNYVTPQFLCSFNFRDAGKDINAPCPTLLTKDRYSLVSLSLANYYSGGGQHSSPEAPCPAVTTVPKQRLVSPVFIDQQFGQSKPAGTDRPLGCVTANPKYNLVSVKPWVMNTSFSNVGSQIDEPAQTITANRKWHYLMNPQFAPSSGCGIDNPCFTLIAKMDKKPPYLVVTETGDIAIEVYETDSPMVRKIKEFMAAHGIVDIKMRMLKIVELKRIMGFPEDYVLVGTQADQKKFIGNAVEVNMARVLCEALCKRLVELKRKVA